MNLKTKKSYAACFIFTFVIIYSFALDSGRHFILTAPTYDKLSEYENWLEKTKPAGVMLVEYHMQDRLKAKQICSTLQNKAKDLNIYPLLICVDYEGGIVSRGAGINGFVAVPSPYKLASCGKHECFLGGKLIGQQLNDVGISVDFAPSVDLFDPQNYILATRCFSQDPQIVTQSATSFIHGLLTSGVLPVIKHFPGLQFGEFDTHTNSNVKINLQNQEFENNIFPFKHILLQKLPVAIMVGHAEYEQFGNIPASISPAVSSWIKQHNAQALIITDDIAMQAYHKANNESEKMECICNTAIKSIKNGFDLLIFSASDTEQIALLNKLDSLDLDKITNQSEIRSKIKVIFNKLKKSKVNLLNEHQTSSKLAKKSITCNSVTFNSVAGNLDSIDLENKIILVSVDLAKIRPATSFTVLEQNKLAQKTLLTKLFEDHGYNVSEFIFNPMKQNSVEKLKTLTYTSLFQEGDIIILQSFFYGSGAWNKHQQDWINLLKPYAKKIINFSLGHPYEKNLIPGAKIIELGSFHSPMINAAFDIVKKKLH